MKIPLLMLCALLAALPARAGEALIPLDPPLARRLTDPALHKAPTVVALWSSECPHCKKNLALFARLAQAEPRLLVRTVAVEAASDELAALAGRLDVPGTRYAYGNASPEALAWALDPKWRGELPRTLFLDGRGGMQARSGVVSEAEARALLGLER